MSKKPGPTGRPTAAMGFTELSSTDADASRSFLEKAFHWTFQETPMPNGRYLSYRSPEGNMIGIRATQQAEAPGSMNYVRVEDLTRAEDSIREAGAKIILERTDIPGMGSFFWFKIPFGPLMACWQDEKPQRGSRR